MTKLVDERVEQALLEQTQRVLRRTIRTSPIALVALPLLTWSEIEHRWLILYLAAATMVSLGTEVQLALGERGLRNGTSSYRRFQLHLALNQLLTSSCWGSVTWMVGGRPTWVQAIAAVYLVAYIAANMVFNAPSRWLFPLYLAPLVCSGVTGFLLFGGATGRTFATVVIGFAAAAAVLHHELHAVFRGAVLREVANEALTQELQRHQAEIERSNELLSYEATHDHLTGLPNRALFNRALVAGVERAQQADAGISVLLIDVDRFKVVNDSLGHHAGDEVLSIFAGRARLALGDGPLLARLGGDEFAVLLDEQWSFDDAVGLGNRLRSTCAEPFLLGERRLVTTVSVGIAHGGNDGETAADLLRRADVAMYRAKRLGRDRAEGFDNSLRDEMDRQVDREIELRDAIANGDIRARFQPIVDVRTGEIKGAEALARWMHPVEGELAPAAFLSTVDECGLGAALFAGMLREAARFLRVVDREGISLAGSFRVWVNFDPNTARRIGESVERLVQSIGFDPQRLGVEVTETSVMHDVDGAKAVLERLRSIGVQSALDDFGTGHSSLSLLQMLPVDKVKIDRSFVRDVAEDQRDLTLVRAIAGLAADLGLGVVAEGVETEEQRGILAELGCEHAQGFLFARPVSADRLVELLAEGTPWSALGAAPSVGR